MTVATGGPSLGRRARGRRAIVRGLPLGPAVALLAVFLLGPILYGVGLSLTDLQLTGASETHFVGIDNYVKAFSSADFRVSVLYTLFFTVVSAVIGQNVLGMLLALLMRSASAPVRAVVSAIVIGAWVLPEVVIGFLWLSFFYEDGTLNTVLGWLGGAGQNWIFTFPILAVSIANIWRGTAFSMLVYSAALSDVPQDVVEAARVDGAGTWRTLFSITLPMVRRSIATNLMLITLQTLSVFGLIWAMTKGGPSGKSTTMPVFAYEQAIQYSQLGYGTALALILLVIGALFSLIYLRVLRLEESST
jgi:multiple sugar transport system permease protein